MKKIFKKVKLPKMKKKARKKPTRNFLSFNRIGNRISIPTIGILVSLVLIISFISYYISQKRLIESANQLLVHKAQDTATIVDNQIKSYTQAIETLGHLNIISNPDIPTEVKFETLKPEKDRLGFNNIGIADIEGNLILDSYLKRSVVGTEYFEKAKKGVTYFSQPMKNNLTGENEIVISSPIIHNSEIVGVIIGYIDANRLYYIIESIQIGERGQAYILNEVTDIISHPTIVGSNTDNEFYYNKPINFSSLEQRVDEGFKNELDQIYNEIRQGQVGTGKYVSEGRAIRIGYAPIKSKNWTLVVSLDESEVLGGLESLKNGSILTLILAIIVGVVFSILLSRSITKPIYAITNYCQKLAQLDLSSDVDERVLKQKDEIGQMGNSLQIVVDNIRNFAKEVRDSSHHVAASSEELAAISEESTAAATSIAENSNEIAESSNRQLEEILKITSAIDEMAEQIEYVSNQIGGAENNSRNVYERTKIGKDRIDNVISQMNNIKDSTQRVKASLMNITISSNKMNQMLEMIENIAEQTNLLALNAAIEAARAGEHGRGFSVVAEEIRKLAEETQKSTEEIYQLIRGNNRLIEEANENMDLNSQEVEVGVEEVNEAKKAFDEIANSILQVTVSINEVAAATNSVESHMEGLRESSHSIEDMSKNIAGQIQNASAASEEQMASMEEITSSTESLATLAEELEAITANIKL